MLRWSDQQVAALATAASQSLTAPSVLYVQGAAGLGKSSFLRELRARVPDHVPLVTEALEFAGEPYAVLRQWGVAPPVVGDRRPDPALAAQALRLRLDALPAGKPVLLVLDDAQWADSESLEAIRQLLLRADGDRLLVAVGARPAHTDQFRAWQEWIRSTPNVVDVRLDGLSRSSVRDMIAAEYPGVSPATADALWSHTEGNPFYLRALLGEYDAGDMARARVLPAPAEFRRLVQRRLLTLPEPALELLQTVAVLGTDWSSLRLLAAVADQDDVSSAAQACLDVDLLVAREDAAGVSVRAPHALTAAAVYQQTPLPRRRELHQRVAATVSDRSLALRHRISAADRWDDDLAAEVDRFAAGLHDRYSFRSAAEHYAWAAQLWADPLRRARSCTEALLCRVRDHQDVADDIRPGRLAEEGLTQDQIALVEAAAAVATGRWMDGVRLLAPLTQGAPGVPDSRDRHRAECLLAWARAGVGADEMSIIEGVERATSLSQRDPTLEAYAQYALANASLRIQGMEAALGHLDGLPAAPVDFPPEQTPLLLWRGFLLAQNGFLARAIADLREAERRIATGLTEIVDGGFHCCLGVTLWFAGEWDEARVAMGLSRDLAGSFVLPPALAYGPLHPSGVGHFAEADERLDEARKTLRTIPYPDAIQWLLVNEVVRAHAGGVSAEQRLVWAEAQARWPDFTYGSALAGAFVLMHMAQATIWALDVDATQRLLARMDRLTLRPAWLGGVTPWLHGLLAERQGDHQGAWRSLRTAAAADTTAIPFYRAHILTDLARLARRNGSQDAATQATTDAARIYTRLGAAPYLQRLEPTSAPLPFTTSQLGDTLGLTGREHDVAVLTLQGLSYAQIAATLFITQSTVSFHLGKVYAKAGVTSRHQLRDLVTAPPGGQQPAAPDRHDPVFNRRS